MVGRLCSAMPMSKLRSGKAFLKPSVWQESAMSVSMTTTAGFVLPNSTRASP